MDNPWSGVLNLKVDGVERDMCLTLGALAELETVLGDDTLVALVSRFEEGRFSNQDVLSLIVAGLRGGGWDVSAKDLLSSDIAGGPIGCAKAVAQLLARAFLLPEERQG